VIVETEKARGSCEAKKTNATRLDTTRKESNIPNPSLVRAVKEIGNEAISEVKGLIPKTTRIRPPH
jgi:hypothetical protein